MQSWVSVDLRTGAVLADLPDLKVDRASVVLGAYSTTTAMLPLPTAPENWYDATLPYGSALILIEDDQDGTTPRILWGGIVTRQPRDLGDVLSLSLITPEGYLDRRYVGDETYTGTSQTAIVEDLIDQFVNDATITFRVEATASATTRDRTYADADDKTVYSALTELMGVDGGPEWTAGWEWQHSPERITPVLYVADRIGSAVTAGLGPAATFEAPGPVITATLDADYAKGKGANSVTAVSSAVAGDRPQSAPQVYSDARRPTVEHRFTPSTSITEVSTLTSHAQAALALMIGGGSALTLTAVVQDAPPLGVDWFLGDDIGYRITGAPAFPNGLEGVARCIGWERALTEPQTITPILLTEGEF